MTQITQSMITAAVSLINAEIVLTDGRYEQWGEAFIKALNQASDQKWTDNGWTYSGVMQRHVWMLQAADPKVNVSLYFGVSQGTGNYVLSQVVLTSPDTGRHGMRIARGKGLPGNAPVVLNNKDLIAIMSVIKDGSEFNPTKK